MFTGIVEEIGTVRQIVRSVQSSHFVIQAERVLQGTVVGDSICTSGVCLTVTALGSDCFEADVMAETLRCSKLGTLAVGSAVNLERALSLQTRLGGHMVSGHIDGTGTIARMTREDNAVWVTIEASARLLKYIVPKGSIAIDGISLTVARVYQTGFQVSIIPHTGQQTTLLRQTAGDQVNLECDIIGKYVERLLGFAEQLPNQTEPITAAYLAEHGFI